MKNLDYLERVYPAYNVAEVPEGALVVELDGVYMPYYWLPLHVLGHSVGAAHIRVFRKNPGLKRLYEFFSQDKCRYIAIVGRRISAVTPRSMFFHLARRAPSTASLVRSLISSADRCLSHLSTVKTIVGKMIAWKSGHIPLCRGGKIVYVASARGVALYLEEGGHTTTRATSLDTKYLVEPPRASELSSFLNLLRKYSYGVYETGGGRQVFASERGLYEAVRRALTENTR